MLKFRGTPIHPIKGKGIIQDQRAHQIVPEGFEVRMKILASKPFMQIDVAVARERPIASE